jgi:hypothetical protein
VGAVFIVAALRVVVDEELDDELDEEPDDDFLEDDDLVIIS